MQFGRQRCACEWAYDSSVAYADPFNDVQLDVVFRGPDGGEQIVPTFWAGDQTWRVRFAPAAVGTYTYRTVCSDQKNQSLHGLAGTLEVKPYDGPNTLLRHGPPRVAVDRRHFEHADGTPFFWLGDTWWWGLCQRLEWPAGFQELTEDRVAKGFTVIHIVAGLYPDETPFDPRGVNEAGFPWTEDTTRINPAYFDLADVRIAHLVRAGLVPYVVAAWGFYLDVVGPDLLKRYWRYLVARWGAYPVVWCVAGEADLALYFPTKIFRNQDEPLTNRPAIWSDIARDLRKTDPYHHPITIHPWRYCHEVVDDPSVLDFYTLQAGHNGYPTLATAVDMVCNTLALEPRLPVLMGEVNYEGILESSWEDIQRFQFWSCLLSGAVGFSYGATGVMQFNRRGQPHGPGAENVDWGQVPWEDAYRFPGSAQLGIGKGLLERYPWWQFEPHPEWVEPHNTPGNRIAGYAAGIPGLLCVAYLPAETVKATVGGQALTFRCLRPGGTYHAFYFSPKTGEERRLGSVTADEHGEYRVPRPALLQDWVFVLDGLAV